MALEPNDLFDFIEVELEDYMLANGQTDKAEGLDLMRNSIFKLYSSKYEYVKFKKLYGTRDAPRGGNLVDDGFQADDPFGRTSGPRPYLQQTEQFETGFAGLDAPLN